MESEVDDCSGGKEGTGWEDDASGEIKTGGVDRAADGAAGSDSGRGREFKSDAEGREAEGGEREGMKSAKTGLQPVAASSTGGEGGRGNMPSLMSVNGGMGTLSSG